MQRDSYWSLTKDKMLASHADRPRKWLVLHTKYKQTKKAHVRANVNNLIQVQQNMIADLSMFHSVCLHTSTERGWVMKKNYPDHSCLPNFSESINEWIK